MTVTKSKTRHPTSQLSAFGDPRQQQSQALSGTQVVCLPHVPLLFAQPAPEFFGGGGCCFYLRVHHLPVEAGLAGGAGPTSSQRPPREGRPVPGRRCAHHVPRDPNCASLFNSAGIPRRLLPLRAGLGGEPLPVFGHACPPTPAWPRAVWRTKDLKSKDERKGSFSAAARPGCTDLAGAGKQSAGELAAPRSARLGGAAPPRALRSARAGQAARPSPNARPPAQPSPALLSVSRQVGEPFSERRAELRSASSWATY